MIFMLQSQSSHCAQSNISAEMKQVKTLSEREPQNTGNTSPSAVLKYAACLQQGGSTRGV